MALKFTPADHLYFNGKCTPITSKKAKGVKHIDNATVEVLVNGNMRTAGKNEVRYVGLASVMRGYVDECHRDRALPDKGNYNDYSGNLQASYGGAIYVYGKMYGEPYYPEHVSPSKPHKGYGDNPDGTGDEYIERYLREYKADGDCIQMVIAAAMWYANWEKRPGSGIYRTPVKWVVEEMKNDKYTYPELESFLKSRGYNCYIYSGYKGE